MASNRIRTLNFLPEIFKTSTNAQFLQATLDQVVGQPNTKIIQGFVGSKFGYGIDPKEYYVTEPTKTRKDYQLEPGVVFTKPNENIATDFISYPGILDAIKLEGGLTDNNNRLFSSQFYSWDSFTDLDKLINYNQYYWLPNGPQAVVVEPGTVYNEENYIVNSLPNAFNITSNEALPGSINPTLTLLRGGSYTFEVDQTTQFWIQGYPGVTGASPIQPNLNTREILGVQNNGATNGVITFNVPTQNAQLEYSLPGNNNVDLLSTLPFSQINGQLLSSLGSIDGVTSLNGLSLMFYNTGVNDGTNNNFYTISLVGVMSNPTIMLTISGAIPIQENISVQNGTQWVGRKFFKNISTGNIEIVPFISAPLDTLYYQDSTNPDKVGVIKLIDSNAINPINVNQEILGKKTYTAANGVVFTNGLKVLFQGNIIPESYLSGEYYVEGVGTAIEILPVIELIPPQAFTQPEFLPYDTNPYDSSNYDVNLVIPKNPDYITIARNAKNRNAWARSNRWFHIDVINATALYNNDPTLVSTYVNKQNKAVRPIIEFYPNLKLFNTGTTAKSAIDFIDFRTTDAFSEVIGQSVYYPDVTAWTIFPGTAAIAPVTGNIVTTGVSTTFVGSRIGCISTSGFKIGDSVVFSDMTIDGITVTQFGSLAAGTTYYISEIINNTTFTVSQTKFGPTTATTAVAVGIGTSMVVTVTPLSTFVTVATADIMNTPAAGQYIADSTLVLPRNSQIISVSGLNTPVTTIQVGWNAFTAISGTSSASLSMSRTNLENFQLFDGARIVFAKDETIKNKIFVAQFSKLTPSSPFVITLSVAGDGDVLESNQVVATRGYYNGGKEFYYEEGWLNAQQKNTLNQPPLFDVFDSNGISFGNKDYYLGSSFKGCKLFAYGIGVGKDDPILNFPLRYSEIDNVGDISFDVSLNIDTFEYIKNSAPIIQQVNTGYVYNYYTRNEFTRELGWQTAVAPSAQYQVFEFNFNPTAQPPIFKLDVLPVNSGHTNWPIIQVYVNNTLLEDTQYDVTTSQETTINIINGFSPSEPSVIQILIISDEVSSTAYYSVPINLTNNPFNKDPKILNVGDIRGQYQSIFYNNPQTSGKVFGSNNYRDLGNMVPYGNRIIQNSASLVLPGTFLRKQNYNFFNSVEFNSRSYTTFKALLLDVVNKTEYNVYQSPAEILDDALDQITSTKTDTAPFFWSDMLPSKAPFITNTYSFNVNFLSTSIYPLSKVYNFKQANYEGVLVYRTKIIDGLLHQTQLIANVDYIISNVAPSLSLTIPLEAGDQIIINEYNQTYGSYIPNTPTKLGLYPATIPSVILDSDYTIPTYFIRGHDGSYNKLYGNYDPVTGKLVDFRDQVLLEFEKRIYNNLKLSAAIPIPETDIIPGFWRETDYTTNEILQIYSELFLNWVGQNRINFQEQQYNVDNFFSYNYLLSGNKINNQPIEQGNWRGIYKHYFDTTNVSSKPWEMIGHTTKPSWWEDRYGPAPYTSDNLVLWNDLAQGIDYNDGVPIVKSQYIRPELLNVLPVDSQGLLLPPLNAVVGNYTGKLFKKNWKVGDSGPAEFSYLRSASWPFDLMKILALTNPVRFFNLGVDLDNYKYNEEFDQYLVNDRKHLNINEIQIYGSGTPKTSYINWIVDYEKQLGIDATSNIMSLLNNLDVRLVYRLAGFSDKNLLKFFVEKSVPSSRSSSLLIPDESYSVLLYENQPFDRIMYSGVVIQKTNNGFAVYGNSQTKAYFTILSSENNGKSDSLNIEKLSVLLPIDYTNKKIVVPYGTVFNNIQEVTTFLTGYGAYLVSQGMTFNQVENGLEVTWKQMAAEFLYWAQLGWEVGSITTLNPAATNLTINKDSYIVQPLTITSQNFVLNQNLYPIQSKDLSIVRDGTSFSLQPLNQGDTLGYGQFNISNFEHGIVFDNLTLFNDTLYSPISGLKQNRIYVRGSKTADWNGTIDISGFILNQDNIREWNPSTKYTTGSIVKFKNKFWTATKIVQPKESFQETEWKETDYNEIQKGLLPNSSTRSYESTLYYDVNKANLETDADLLSFSLIGFRPRDYMTVSDLTDISQVNLYQNIIRNKGTRNAIDAFKGVSLSHGDIDYNVYENWAVKEAEFGGTLASNFIELKLQQNLLTGNPAIVALNNGSFTPGAQQEVPIHSLYNYGRPITTNHILETLPPNTPPLFMDAGYVNLDDIKLSSYFFSGLPIGTNKYGVQVPLAQLYVRDYVWLANYLSSWQVLTPLAIGQVIFAKNNLNNTTTITFDQPHNLTQFDIFAIVNFNEQINGYYLAALIIDPYKVIINLALTPSIRDREILGQGIGLKFQSQKVNQPSNIADLPLLSAEFSNNKVWVDQSPMGDWAVYRKTLNYTPLTQFGRQGAETYGTAVAYTPQAGYLISDAGLGKVYRYVFNTLTKQFDLRQEITSGISFGSSIAYEDDLFAISEPLGTPRVHLYKFNVENNLGETINKLEPLPQEFIPAQDGSTNWGKSLAISGDKNWIYVSAPDLAAIYVYKLNRTTNIYELATNGMVPVTLTMPGLNSTDNFGYSIATDYYGETIIVGAPDVNYNNNIENWGHAYVFNRIVQTFNVATTTSTPLGTQTFNLAWNPAGSLVYVNGRLLDNTSYSFTNNSVVVSSILVPGDLLTISGQVFSLVQTLTTQKTPRIGVNFGYSVDTNKFANEVLVGAPFDLDSNSQEGAVYRFTNAGEKYGLITGHAPCSVVTSSTILINGFRVDPQGDANSVVTAIKNAQIPNVTASEDNGILTIQLIDTELGALGTKLSIVVTDSTILDQMGLTLYIKTQEIKSPHSVGPTQFGKAISLNESGSFVASAPVGTRFNATTFDAIVDDSLDNDTLFDNNSTQWIDEFSNAGAVYMFDYLSNYNESITNVGKYVYAQSINDDSVVYGTQPYYGSSLTFNQNVVLVGTPEFLPGATNGKINIFQSLKNSPDWSIYRNPVATVNINKVENIQLCNVETNNTLDNLDYIDPLQGKLLGVVRENLDYIAANDPAGYNDENNNATLFWAESQVGKIWFNTSNVRFLNYHQDNNVYNSEVWGKVFPGSDVAVYSWIESNVIPALYSGPGTPFNIENYSTRYILSASGDLTPVYYYWVRNTNFIFTNLGKTLSDSILETYIANPKNSGISYFAPLLPNLYALYNVNSSINANDSVLHIGFNSGDSKEIAHSQFQLIRANFADDFLPGLPSNTNIHPQGLYDRMLDSMSGVDERGQIVPDPSLPIAVRTGILARPRQSFFLHRFGALKNYFQYINSVLAQFPITEIRNPEGTYLTKVGPLNTSVIPSIPFYNTLAYWEYINWWAPGYSDTTKSVMQVQLYASLATLNVAPNTIVRVANNDSGLSETYIYQVEHNTGTWVRIGLTNGTIRFKAGLWDYQETATGFGANFFDSMPYDQYPSEETRYILRAINEQILIDDLLIFRNKGLITLFEYIQNESLETQNYLPWLNKTSFIDVFHTLRQLKPYEVFQNDNQALLTGYINEVKPFHVVIKEFVFKYEGEELYAGNITDFDLPAQYNSLYEQFITPALVNSNPNLVSEYMPNNSIWQTPEYSEWFSNRGISIVGQNNYPIALLASELSLNSSTIIVDNTFGFPVSGIITIGNEKISYTDIDRNQHLLTGIFRGAEGTEISVHLPEEQIYIDLPAVIILDGGRNYVEPPKVTAYIDTSLYPAPIEPAILNVTMRGDSVQRVDVIHPGKGYVVTPEIRIDSSITSLFSSDQVNMVSNTIQIFDTEFITGDLIQYKVNSVTTPIIGITPNQWYYVRVVETAPIHIISLYSSYSDAVKDQNKVIFYNPGLGAGHSLNLGAKASCIATASPVRENNTTIRFDRTSYRSKVIDWAPNEYYGSSFASEYYTDNIGTTLLGSSDGVPFEIVDTEPEQLISWSSAPRTIVSTSSIDNTITLAPYNQTEPNNPDPTLGFYIDMPIYFRGDLGTTNLSENVTYYVTSIVDSTKITISFTLGGGNVSMVDGIVGSTGLLGYPGALSESVLLTLNYPGILGATQTAAGRNYITLPLNSTGSGGTASMAMGTPVTFTGNMIGGIVKDRQYFVTTVVDNQNFTISTEEIPAHSTITAIDSTANTLTLTSTNGFSINDPVIITDLTLFVGYLQLSFQVNVFSNEYIITELSTTDWNALGYQGIPEVGGKFVLSNPLAQFRTMGNLIVGKLYRIFELGDTDWNSIGYNGTPIVGGTFIATGLGNGTGTVVDGLGKVKRTISYPTFSGLNSGVVYYIAEVVSPTQIKLANVINGPVLELTSNSILTALITNQKNVTQLTDDYAIPDVDLPMVVNVDRPISPGQINGQKFTLFSTSPQFVTSGTKTILTERILVTLAVNDRIALADYENGLDNLYVNFPLAMSTDFHGLLSIGSGQTYYIVEMGRIIVNVTQTNGVVLLCDSTESLFVNMPIIFSRESLGLINLHVKYFVKEILSATEFTISSEMAGSEVILQNQTTLSTGMLGTGSPYIKVSTTLSGNPVNLGNSQLVVTNVSIATPTVVTAVGGQFNNGTLVRFSNVGNGILPEIVYYVRNVVATPSGAEFNISLTSDGPLVGIPAPVSGTPVVTEVTDITNVLWVQVTDSLDPAQAPNYLVDFKLGRYYVSLSTPGQGYAVTNTITISGADIGGTWPTNNIVINVTEVNAMGGISKYTISGTPNDISNDYYFKVVAPNKVRVYTDPLLSVPINSTNFIFNGATTTSVTGTEAGQPGNIILTNVSGFSTNDPVIFTGYGSPGLGLGLAGPRVGQTYYIATINGNKVQLSNSPGEPAAVEIISDLSFLAYINMTKVGSYALLPKPLTFNQSFVAYNNNIWKCLISNNDSEFVLDKWDLLRSDDRQLNAIDRAKGYYQPTANMPGKDLTQLFTGIEYDSPQYVGNAFSPDEQYPLDTILENLPFNNTSLSDYVIIGEQFASGYGPEELVPGVVTDSLTMIVSTNPGADWSAEEYQHVGYVSNSVEFTPNGAGQVVYSFANITINPQQIRVSVIDKDTLLGRTLIGPNNDGVAHEYTINWNNHTITIVTPLVYLSNTESEILRIDVYEVGNGVQLVRSNTHTDPIRVNAISGFSEIYLNCNYTGQISDGSGAIQPNTEAIQVEVITTNATTNSLYCVDVSKLIPNEVITFQGNVFGNVLEGTTYFIKSISTTTNSITISDQLIMPAGIAGPTFELVDGVGSMFVIANQGQEAVWSTPVVYWNGTKLNLGVSRLCTSTNSGTDTIVCNSTFGISVGDQIIFDNTIFGGIEEHRLYYVRSILGNGIEFNITETQFNPLLDPIPGAVVLTTDFGASYFITNDFTISRQPNNKTRAKLVLVGKPNPSDSTKVIPYNQNNDYITYTLFGETSSVQVGGSIPEIQYITSNGTLGPYKLYNYNQGLNALNAVVEVNGLRVPPADYTINSGPFGAMIDPNSGILDFSNPNNSGLYWAIGSYDSNGTNIFGLNQIMFNSLAVAPAAGAIISVTTYQYTEQQYLSTQTVSGTTVSGISAIATEVVPYIAQVNCLSTSGVTNRILVTTVDDIVLGETVYFKSLTGITVGNVATDGTIYYVRTIDSGTNEITIALSPDPLAPEVSLTTATLDSTAAFVGGIPTTRVYTTVPHNLITNDVVRMINVQGAVELNNQLFYVRVISNTILDLYQYGFSWYTGYNPILNATNLLVTGISNYLGGGFVWENNTFSIPQSILWAERTPTDRLWVTVNGYRVPSSLLKIDSTNISIPYPIAPSDVVIVTTMIPSATPNEHVYLMRVDKKGIGEVYRANPTTRTWLTSPVTPNSDTITVHDASRIVDLLTQQVVVGTPINGSILIELDSDKTTLSHVVIYNNTTGMTVDQQHYSLTIVSTAPNIELNVGNGSTVNVGDILTVTEIQGNLIYLNGEYIRFGSINIVTGVLSELVRGVNGTGAQSNIPVYTQVYGILPTNKLPNSNYNLTWNSNIYDPTLGDPLQISQTNAANFLNTNNTQ